MRRLMTAAVAALALALPANALAVGKVFDVHEHDAYDARTGSVSPTDAQRGAVQAMGARASWSRFGAPSSLYADGGWLAEGLPGGPQAAAREFVRRNAALFRLTGAEVAGLDVVADHTLPGTDAHVVTFGRRIGGLPVAGAGVLSVGVRDGKVAYASSGVAGGSALQGAQSLTAIDAWLEAAEDVGIEKDAADLSVASGLAGFGQLRVAGLDTTQQVREVAVPMPGAAARRAYEVNVVAPERQQAHTVLVDAGTGAVLRRVNRLDQAADQPNWRYFPNNPPVNGSGTDRRIVGCFPAGAAPAAPCTFDERMAAEGATPAAWDVLAGQIAPTLTTNGNNADAGLSSLSPLTPGPDRARPVSATREYDYPFTNAWQESKCDPSNFAGVPDPSLGTNANDINAAIVSLFANHNNMHDWAYALGFTETAFNLQANNFGKGGAAADPELGNAQAGAVGGGTPTYTGRDNANQITLQDGIAPITNMYLWQPIGGAFYPPCVDGDFDMSVIGHEYTHAISNRMVGGPDEGLVSGSDGQARAMGESFSDLAAVEFLMEHGLAPSDDENPFAVGAYVTGSEQKGIRNYGMNASPLNFSDVQGYDGSGMESPHDDGEIWSAVNHDIRQALVAKHGAGSAAEQLACARGEQPADECPGNRRWIQTMFDAFLLMPAETSMLDARDAYLAAERLRTDGADQAELWNAFARRGFGEKAASPAVGDTAGTDNPDPRPSFESPLRADEATVTFKPTDADARIPVKAELFVGDYEANVTPVADTDGATALGDSVALLPGTYAFVVRADGYGAQRFERTIAPGGRIDLNVLMPGNRASAKAGATATGDGGNLPFLIDDTEETNWAAAERTPDVAGTQVTVKLAGGAQLIDRVNVSALLRAVDEGDSQDPAGNQNRFTALRQFAIETCTGACTADGDFDRIYTSPADAFPGGVPRPLAPDMVMRGFDVPDTRASHVRMVVLSNQCSGNPLYSDPTLENDPTSTSDCTETTAALSRRDQDVRAAELQVFGRAPEVTVTPSPAAGSGGGGGAPAAPVVTPTTPEVCASTAGFSAAKAKPRGRGLRLGFTRRARNPVAVDVFRQSSGRRVLDNRLVKRFRGKSRAFTWRGSRKLGDGLYFARFRVRTDAGRIDTRRTALRRRGGRFTVRPAFYRRASCGLLSSYKLSSAAFGGTTGRKLGIAFQLERRARVSVAVLRGKKVVRRFKTVTRPAGRTHRLSLKSGALRRGDHRVRVRAVAGARRVTAVLVARRL